jgi:molecular chaperone Hsp33
MTHGSDSVVRAMTNDGAFRVITVRTTETVRGAISAQHGIGRTARYFGELLTGAILIRETMAPPLRVQGILRGAHGQGSLVADSHPSGMTRGLIQLPQSGRQVELDGAVLQVMRTMPNGRIAQGVVEMPDAGGVSRALMAYMQISEQVLSMIAVSTVMVEDNVMSAGGYIVQLLPEVGRGPLMVMTERLRDFESIDQQLLRNDFSPRWLLDQLLYGMPFTHLDESQVSFECWCSELRLMEAMATLSKKDLEDLVRSGELLEISCDYCGKQYAIPPAQLRGLLDSS